MLKCTHTIWKGPNGTIKVLLTPIALAVLLTQLSYMNRGKNATSLYSLCDNDRNQVSGLQAVLLAKECFVLLNSCKKSQNMRIRACAGSGVRGPELSSSSPRAGPCNSLYGSAEPCLQGSLR